MLFQRKNSIKRKMYEANESLLAAEKNDEEKKSF